MIGPQQFVQASSLGRNEQEHVLIVQSTNKAPTYEWVQEDNPSNEEHFAETYQRNQLN